MRRETGTTTTIRASPVYLGHDRNHPAGHRKPSTRPQPRRARPPWCGQATRYSWSTAAAAFCSAWRRSGVGPSGLSALLLTHLHSDHIADLGDLIISSWITNFGTAEAAGDHRSAGTKTVVDATLVAFGSDIGYRIAHHADLNAPPDVQVHEYTDGQVWDRATG